VFVSSCLPSSSKSGSPHQIISAFAVCQRVCRVQFLGHTAKSNFVECLQINTRQTRGTRQIMLCCVIYFGTRQSYVFAVCFFLAHGKVLNLPCAFFAHGKIIIRNSFSHLETFSTLHIWHVVLDVKFWYIFVLIYYI
jgi:hypothetical protein